MIKLITFSQTFKKKNFSDKYNASFTRSFSHLKDYSTEKLNYYSTPISEKQATQKGKPFLAFKKMPRSLCLTVYKKSEENPILIKNLLFV